MKTAIKLVQDCICDLEQHLGDIEDEEVKQEVKALIVDIDTALDHYR
jgi:hypothetical protein